MKILYLFLLTCLSARAQFEIIIHGCTSTSATLSTSNEGSGGGFMIQSKTNLNDPWRTLGEYFYPAVTTYNFPECEARYFRAFDIASTIIGPTNEPPMLMTTRFQTK